MFRVQKVKCQLNIDGLVGGQVLAREWEPDRCAQK